MDNINISTTQEVDISLQADDIDYIVLNDGITELQSAIQDIVSDDKLTQGIITAVGDTKYQPIGDYVTNSELNSKGFLTTIPEDYITDAELEAKGYITEHQSLKTINGESLVGSGNITIEGGGGDMTNYYTKVEIDNLVGNINNELESI